jgi:hypothetical protein
MVQAAVAAGEQLAPVPAAVLAAARTLAVLLIVIAQVSVASELAEQRALPAPVVADIGVGRRQEMHCNALVGQCWPCFGLVIARTSCISEEQGCLVATRRAARWERMAQFFGAQYLMSFPVASVQDAEASIHRCSSEGWKVNLDRVLEAFSLMALVLLWGSRSFLVHS